MVFFKSSKSLVEHRVPPLLGVRRPCTRHGSGKPANGENHGGFIGDAPVANFFYVARKVEHRVNAPNEAEYLFVV